MWLKPKILSDLLIPLGLEKPQMMWTLVQKVSNSPIHAYRELLINH